MPANSPATRTDRDDVLHLLAEVIDLTHDRITTFEADSPADEELQIKWIRTFGQLTGQYRHLLNDEELDEMADVIKRLTPDEDA